MSKTQISAAELRARRQELHDSLDDLEFEQFAVRLGCEPARATSLSREIDATGNELTAVNDELARLAEPKRYSPPRLTRRYVDDTFNELIARF